jgi:hypothetical protein
MDDSNSGFWTMQAMLTWGDKEDKSDSAPAYLPIHIKSPFTSAVFRVCTYFWLPLKVVSGAHARYWCHSGARMVHCGMLFSTDGIGCVLQKF